MNSDILFLIHISDHWVLAILLGRKKELILIDSMHKSHPNITNNIIRWYHDMMSFLDIPSQFPMNNWNIVSSNRNSPLQTDTHSCRVFCDNDSYLLDYGTSTFYKIRLGASTFAEITILLLLSISSYFEQ